MALLLERRAQQKQYAQEIGMELVADAYVLSTHADGSQPCLPDSLGRAYWRLAHEIGVHTRFHDLRHFVAAQAIAAGIDVRTVAGRLGHADPAITLRVYSHVLAEGDRAAAALLGGLVLGPGILERPPARRASSGKNRSWVGRISSGARSEGPN